MNSLLYKIEKCRKEMIELASNKSLSDEKVIEVSKKLDELLNQYNHSNDHKRKSSQV